MCIILYLHSIFLRELGSLNFFKQKVVAHWPDDWTASNTKVEKVTRFMGAMKKNKNTLLAEMSVKGSLPQ